MAGQRLVGFRLQGGHLGKYVLACADDVALAGAVGEGLDEEIFVERARL